VLCIETLWPMIPDTITALKRSYKVNFAPLVVENNPPV
jgi:hypothetical protein